MTVGPLARVEVSRGSFTGTSQKLGSLVSGHSFSLPQGFLANATAGGAFAQVSSSAESSRDASPARQTAGALVCSEWQASSTEWQARTKNLLANELAQADIAAADGPCIDTEAVLQEVPSLAYELGLKALWLDRHPSLSGLSRYSGQNDSRYSGQDNSRYSCQDDSQPLPKPPLSAGRPGASCLSYCPSWRISESMIWPLAERYVRESPKPPPSPSPLAPAPGGPSSHPANATESNRPPGAANTAGFDASPPSPPSHATPKSSAGVQTATALSIDLREAPPLPSGIGPVGLSSPKQRFRRAALSIIARSRLELKKNLKEASIQAGEVATSADGGAAPPAADFTSSITVGGGSLASASPAQQQQQASAQPSSKRSGSFRIDHVVADAVADAVCNVVAPTPTPRSRAALRLRVRALVAGVSVLYTAVNLGGCAAAVMHADFANDFASSAKAVLDFMVTAPSVTGIAQDLMSIGVAVGLGMAQRRPHC